MFVCISGGFPALPFLINEDISTGDGAIVCRELTALDTAQLGWRVLRLLKYLRVPPIPF